MAMSANPNAEAEIQALLSDLWQKHLPSMQARLSTLDHIARVVGTGQLDESQRAEAQSIAHKLAGNLGMFGHQQAGIVAGEIEQALKQSAFDRIPALAQQMQTLLAPYLT